MKTPSIPTGIPLTIDQVSMIIKEPKSTIRYWEKCFEGYLEPERTEGNRRMFEAKDVRKLLKIRDLLRKNKYTVAGAKKKLGVK